MADAARLDVTPAALPGGWLGQQLQRLQRLLALRAAHAAHLNAEGRHLLDHAIFTTFVDCRDLGAETLASALLAQEGLTAATAGAEAAAALRSAPPGDAAG